MSLCLQGSTNRVWELSTECHTDPGEMGHRGVLFFDTKIDLVHVLIDRSREGYLGESQRSCEPAFCGKGLMRACEQVGQG